ncbi:alpha/beta fold hydrolase [Phytoactinopolyspora alkaliphila]|uniref:Alpha/beta fold hydrolase n=1 Tax=Phytoactinopolyspora alkaliphila TaxID=1783498 RepID=A0A6N9YHQ5_9ACTN|nr:alpha/beta fold hydrolase [Phytoactinopolyspora alkaliphila]NED94504.1 alpha/beta fold hydrolase [Phytoactinopolyspora alkaliphila]
MVKGPQIKHSVANVDGIEVFYRENGPKDSLPVLLLHGFPSASHQYRRLMEALGTSYRFIAPDYPGFGRTEAPEGFTYTFDNLAAVVHGFVRKLGLRRFALYMFDFGAPVGFRLAQLDPHAVAGLIVQNANAYDDGLSATARHFILDATADEIRRDLLTLQATKSQYLDGAADVARIDPDNWTLDQHFLDLPGRQDAQVDLALDYKSNLAEYPRWQAWMREHQPPALVVWGRGDQIFMEAGAHAYLRDLPSAELQLFDTGHFALEEGLPEIAPLLARFLDRVSIMKIAVIGGTGRLGGAIVREAVSRGHDVTPLGSTDVDVTEPVSIRGVVANHDAVVASVKGSGALVAKGAQALLAANVGRLVFVGGGASLRRPSGEMFIESPGFPAQFLSTAQDQVEALRILRASDTDTEWSYVSPPPVHLVDGPRTGVYRVATDDEPVVGEATISVADLAVAVVDAVERRTFVGQRFTVGY